MKKILSLLLCVALLCSMVVVAAHADDVPTAQFANAVGVANGTVKINMNIANNTLGVGAFRFTITDDNGLGATFEGVDNEDDTLGLTANDAQGIYFWSGAVNNYNTTFGTLTITIPEDAEVGDYTFTVVADQGGYFNSLNKATKLTIEGTTFTVTVTDKVIDGMNVAIDAGTAIGVHVQTTNPDNTSITALYNNEENPEEKPEFITIADYEADEENGGYFYYLNVNPWDMDKVFTVDFTENFAINDKDTEDAADDTLDTEAIPGTAKTVSIVDYCEKVKGTSDELDQLIADMLEFGRQAQAYQNMTVTITIPEGLAATEGAWENGDGDPVSFGDYCSENFPEDLTGKNATAKKKFEFDKAEIEFGSKFKATFIFKNGATATAFNLARVKVNGETYSLTQNEETKDWEFTYAFSPAEYAGVEFDLYAAASTTATNFAWINNYGPSHFAAYLNDNGVTEAMDLLEAFYNYGVSVETYVATLGE